MFHYTRRHITPIIISSVLIIASINHGYALTSNKKDIQEPISIKPINTISTNVTLHTNNTNIEKYIPKCKPVILCGPSGVGKSTLISMLRKEFPEDYGFSVSHTTRAPRPGEKDGIDYYFVQKEDMEKEIAAGVFLETAHVHGNIYGTSKKSVDNVSAKCVSCILDIDIQV